MPRQRPFLIFPEATSAVRSKLGGGPIRLHRPTPGQQKQRLDQKFRSIASSIQAIQPSLNGAEPEQVIVFETCGTTITNLVKAVARIPGLEWLAEMDLDSVVPDEYFFDEGRPDASLPCRLYAVVTNQRAMDELYPCGRTGSRIHHSVRQADLARSRPCFRISGRPPLGATGPIEESQIIADWQSSLVKLADERIRFEAELWCCAQNGRNQAYATFQALVAAQGGTCLALATDFRHQLSRRLGRDARGCGAANLAPD